MGETRVVEGSRVPEGRWGTRRVVLWVPDWPTTSLVVDTPPGAPAAVVHRGRVTVTTAPARRAGVRVGMPQSTAQYLCPDLVLLPHDPLREAAAFEPVARAFDEVAAGVVCLRPGLAWAPATGPARWAGSEEALAGDLVETVVAGTGAECQVGVASGMLAALESARRGLVVQPADTPELLADLPLDRVLLVLPTALRDLVADALDLLPQLGVRTCSDLVGLGRRALLTRFGHAGEVLWSLCTGGDLPTRAMRRRTESIEVSTTFDPPAGDVDEVVIGLRRLAEELAEELWRLGASAATLTVWMATETGQRRDRTWGGVDCASPADVVDRMRWQLRGWTQERGSAAPGAQAPDSALERVGLVASDLSVTPPSPRLWGRADGDARAERSALRLQSLLGEDGVLSPHLQGGHDPRSRVRETPWGTPVGTLAPLEGEWEGGVDSAPATVLEVPPPSTCGGVPVTGTPEPPARRTCRRSGRVPRSPRIRWRPVGCRCAGCPGCAGERRVGRTRRGQGRAWCRCTWVPRGAGRPPRPPPPRSGGRDPAPGGPGGRGGGATRGRVRPLGCARPVVGGTRLATFPPCLPACGTRGRRPAPARPARGAVVRGGCLRLSGVPGGRCPARGADGDGGPTVGSPGRHETGRTAMAKLYFRYGAMNSGKSTALLQVAYNYEERDQRVVLVKPRIDTKGDAEIVSRLGMTRTVDVLLAPDDEVPAVFERTAREDPHPGPDGEPRRVAAVLIDEAQFLTPRQVDDFLRLAVLGDVPVLAYGIRTDFRTEAFPGARRLLEIAHSLEELKTICRCGRKAVFNARRVGGRFVFDGAQVAIDGVDSEYESLCGACYLQESGGALGGEDA